MFWFDFNWQIQQFLIQFWWQINFLLLVILVIIGYLAYKKPIYALGLTIVLLPTYLFRSYVWFLPFTFLELCICVTFLGWLFAKMSSRGGSTEQNDETISKEIASPRSRIGARNDTKLIDWLWPIILILLTSTISLLIAPDWPAAAGLWKAYFIEPLLFFLVLTNVLKNDKDKEIILWSLGLATLVVSLLAIYQKFTGFGIAEPGWVGADHRRVTSIFTSPNSVGLYLGPIVMIYLSWLIAEVKNVRRSILKILILTPALLAILFTLSQGTWLGMLAAAIFLGYFARPAEAGRSGGWNKKWTTIIVALAVILVLLVPTARNIVWPTLTFQDAAGQNRLVLLQMSQQYLLENPKNFVLGAGIFGFSQIQNQLREPLKMEALLYPHNIIFNFWLEIGLLGLAAFGWLIIKFFKAGATSYQLPTTNYRWLTLGLMAAMIVILVHGLVDVPYFKNDLAILFWIIIGLANQDYRG